MSGTRQLAAFALFAALASACGAKVTKSSRIRLGAEPEPAPADVGGAEDESVGGGGGTEEAESEPAGKRLRDLGHAERVFAQTRSPLRFAIDRELLAGGGTLTVVNVSADATLVKAPVDELTSLEGATSFKADGSGGGVLTIWPRLLLLEDAIGYGSTDLRILVSSAAELRTMTARIAVADFAAFGQAVTFFPSGAQAGGGLQGWVSPFKRPLARERGQSLTVGALEMVNR